MNITIFERFNQNLGDFPLVTILNGVRDGRWSKKVNAIRNALSEGDTERADRLKKSLPAFTFSATYSGNRRKESISRYTGLIILDVDKLDADQVDPIAWAAADCPYTLFCFRSPSGRGVKIGVDPLAVDEAPLIRHALTMENHKTTFLDCAAFYEKLLDVAVDPSGKDPGRLCFVSADADLYLNAEALEKASKRSVAMPEQPVITEVAAVEVKPEKENDEKNVPADACTLLALFKRIRTRVTIKAGRYAEGNRNNYIFRFACLCRAENIPQEETLGYCRNRFKDFGEAF